VTRIPPDEILNARATVPDHVVHRSFEAETLLLNLDTGQYHGLNQTGGRMLELLDENEGHIGTAIERLAAENDLAPDDIADDLATFCADLHERGLIEVEPGPG
jgi:hypothetical protein